MKTTIFLCIILAHFFRVSSSQTIGFEMVIDTEGRSGISDSKVDYEGNIIFAGGERKLPWFKQAFAFALKVKPNGDVIYRSFDFGNDTMSYLVQVIIAPDSNYIFCGGMGKQDSIELYKEGKNIWIIKLDRELNTIWDKRYELPGDYWNPGCRVWLDNETIYAAGNVDWWNGYHRRNFFMVKFSLNGDTLKTRYPFIDNPMQYPLGQVIGCAMSRPSGQEGMMAVGTSFHVSSQTGIVEIDDELNYTFTPFVYPWNYSTLLNPAIVRLSDYTYLHASSIHLANQGNMDMMVTRVNKEHVFINDIIYGRTDTADFPASSKCIDYINPHNIFVASINNYFYDDPINTKVSIAVVDSNLNFKGWKWYGGDYNYYIFTLTATHDGGCVIGGSVCDWQNSPQGDVDLWIKKIYADDIITYAEDTPDPLDSDVLVGPNPGRDQLFVKTARKNLRIKLFAANGSIVMDEAITHLPCQEINTYSLKKGSYLFQIIDQNKNKIIESGLWIKN